MQPTAIGRLEIRASDQDACSPNQTLTGYALATIVDQKRQSDGSIAFCVQMRRRSPTESVIYPNPADSYFIVQLATTEEAKKATGATHVTLHNSQGRVVRKEIAKPGSTKLRVETANLPNGLYNLTVEPHKAAVERYHVSIEHTGGAQ